ncbi:mitofusin [Basidiobolus ranarum]|uniref:Mitofusin n=1 Tax=Basidiobolus ranarum TaxID=34480 RepID=A0ABR2X2X5_9FUNG
MSYLPYSSKSNSTSSGLAALDLEQPTASRATSIRPQSRTLHLGQTPTPPTSPFTNPLDQYAQQQIYADKSTRLLGLIRNAQGLVEELQCTNQNRRTIQYPWLTAESQKRPIRRNQTYREDSEVKTMAVPLRRARSNSSSDMPSLITDKAELALNVLKLDVKIGTQTSLDVSKLEESSISKLLDDRFSHALTHLNKLFARISDTSSKMLVTGDLNAGKSTLVNALLKREVVPADQQPCTSLFCEVLDAEMNSGVEEVHGIVDASKYDKNDPSTYTKIDLRHLENTVLDDYEVYTMLKVYCTDRREAKESLLHNGIVDIALIDSPGLNRDSIKTTALFARQEEIDVVVFVVGAENHFTLSGEEFLRSAGREKEYIFIVVNRFDNIRDKARCRRQILEQIKEISPRTYEDADDFVHFVSASNCLNSEETPEEFAQLEQSLRSFALEKRAKSKLAPAKLYLKNIFSDISILSSYNQQRADKDLAEATKSLEENKPAYEEIVGRSQRIIEDADRILEDICSYIDLHSRSKLNNAIETLEEFSSVVEWKGLLYVWQFAQQVKNTMVNFVENRVVECEIKAKERTSVGLQRLDKLGSNKHLDQPQSDIDIDSLFFVPSPTKKLDIQVEISDLIDLKEKFNMMTLSLGSAGMILGKYIGYQKMFSSFLDMGNSVGLQPKRWGWLSVIVGAGAVYFIISDMRYVVERKIANKIRDSVRKTNYVHSQVQRITKESRNILRMSSWDLQTRFQNAVKVQEEQRQQQTNKQKAAIEAKEYFKSLSSKVASYTDAVNAIDTEERKIAASCDL